MLSRLLDAMDRLPDWAFALSIIGPVMLVPTLFCILASNIHPIH